MLRHQVRHQPAHVRLGRDESLVHVLHCGGVVQQERVEVREELASVRLVGCDESLVDVLHRGGGVRVRGDPGIVQQERVEEVSVL